MSPPDLSRPDAGWRNLDGIPLDEHDPVFEEPWQAQAFAMTVALFEAGHFTWEQWAQALGNAITADPDATYWTSWQVALETMVARCGLTDATLIETRTQQWHEAAARTPHGEAIEL
ncbi:MAG: nitrile hydratase accessory protein [Ahrensia sp.]|nr:nitrile hydratase accessory protein [Ahrensia sp.]